MDLHTVPPSVLDGPEVQDLRPRRRQLQHLLVRHGVELSGPLHHVGISGEHAGHVGVDLAEVGVQGGRQRHRRGVGATPAQRGDVGGRGHPLESRHDDDPPLPQSVADPARTDVDDGGSAVGGIGDDARLRAGVGSRRVPGRVDRHGQERHGDALAGGEQKVQLARIRQRCQVVRHCHEVVGGGAHRRDHHHHVVAAPAGGHHPLRHRPDPGGVGHGGPAVLLHDHRHEPRVSWETAGVRPLTFRRDRGKLLLAPPDRGPVTCRHAHSPPDSLGLAAASS